MMFFLLINFHARFKYKDYYLNLCTLLPGVKAYADTFEFCLALWVLIDSSRYTGALGTSIGILVDHRSGTHGFVFQSKFHLF